MYRLLAVISLLAVMSCSTNSGVVGTGPDSYMISKQRMGWLSANGEMATDSMKEAAVYCKEQGKVMLVTATAEKPRTAVTWPSSEIQFVCLSENDPRLKNQNTLVPVSPAPVDKVMSGR